MSNSQMTIQIKKTCFIKISFHGKISVFHIFYFFYVFLIKIQYAKIHLQNHRYTPCYLRTVHSKNIITINVPLGCGNKVYQSIKILFNVNGHSQFEIFSKCTYVFILFCRISFTQRVTKFVLLKAEVISFMLLAHAQEN